MDKLKELGLDENTLVMFSSDNGATFDGDTQGNTNLAQGRVMVEQADWREAPLSRYLGTNCLRSWGGMRLAPARDRLLTGSASIGFTG